MTTLDAASLRARLATDGDAGKRLWIAGPFSLTFAAGASLAGQWRAALSDRGVTMGSRVAVAVTDDDLVAPVLLALWQLGASAVMVPVTAPRAEAIGVLEAAEPVAAVVDHGLAEAWALHTRTLPVFPMARPAKRSLLSRLRPGKAASGGDAQGFPAALPMEPAQLSGSPPEPDIEALVLSTSGSTGQPSLVSISQGNLGAQAETMGRHLGIGAGDAVLNVSPLNHVDGVTGLFMAWWTRATLVRVPFQIHALHEFTDAVWRYDVTHAVVVPTVLSLLLRLAEDVREAFAAERFRLVVCTAAPLSEETWRNFEQATGRPVVNMYGLTECGNVLFAGPDEASRVPGTVGRPVDCELAVLDGDGAPSPTGEQGMLWISGASVAVKAPGVVQRDGRPWFPTGDLARRGEDGLVRIVGREKNVIITGGRNIFPQEIDAALMAHPAVFESATVGMADSVWGEQAQSVVVVRGEEADEAALAAHVAQRLADWKVPRRVHVWSALPKGKTGKVSRVAVRQQLTESGGSEGVAASRDMAAVESEVLSLASQSFRVPREAVTVAARAGEFRGWDSLAHLTFVVALEKAFGLDFDPSEVVAIETLAQAVTAVLGKLEAQGR